jgi:alpha-galactosidase
LRKFLSAVGTVTLLASCSLPLPADVAVGPAPPPVGRKILPPMGWNSWNSGIELTERSIVETIDAMADSGLRDAGYRYVVLDAGWAAPTRNAQGELMPDPDRFPRGMAPLARYAHEKGLLFGLYSSPFNETCGQDVRTASLGHETVDARTFADWGVDYVKYDWCREEADHASQVRVFTDMGSALRATGRRIVYSINPNSSNDPTAGSRFDWSGVADMVRTSGDLVPVWRNVLPPQGPFDPFAGGMFNGVPDQFADATTGSDSPSYQSDPDMLVVGVTWREFFDNHRELLKRAAQTQSLTPTQRAMVELMLAMPTKTVQWMATAQPSLTEDEQRTHFSLWAMLSAPLIAGNDVRSMSATTRSILTNRDVIAIDQDPLASRPHTTADPRVWVKPLADGSAAIAFFNSSETPVDIDTSAAQLGLPPAGCYTARDLWTGTTAQTSGPLTVSSLAPHAVRLERVTTGC